MVQKPIIVTGVVCAHEDRLTQGHPYIPTAPRIYQSLALITSGSMKYTVGKQTTVLSAGEVLFVRPGNIDIAQTASDDPVVYYVVDFSTVSDDFDTATHFLQCAHLAPVFRLLTDTFIAKSIGWQMKCLEMLYRILNELRDLSGSSDFFLYRQIAPAIDLINGRLSDPDLTVSALSYACKISTTGLNRAFRKLFGMPVSQYLLSRRMETAKNLLINASNSVGDIAEKVGYRDIYTFSHAFSRFFGVSPTAWRKQPSD